MIVINFKTYPEATGKEARELAEECLEASEQTGEKVVAVPTAPDLLRLQDLDVEVRSQHLDPVKPGSHTGHMLPENLVDAGVSGTLLNHSEKRIDTGKIRKAVERARENGLETIVCAQNPEECKKYSQLGPDFIAYEPPELIGGEVSVAESRPELIEKAVEKSETEVLTGAGIHSREDVEKSRELGCEGVLVASAVVKAENRVEKIRELCNGL